MNEHKRHCKCAADAQQIIQDLETELAMLRAYVADQIGEILGVVS